MHTGSNHISAYCVLKSVLALFVLCSALLWSLHSSAINDHDAATASTMTDSAQQATTFSPMDLTSAADHCGHGELHHIGLVSDFTRIESGCGFDLQTRQPQIYTSFVSRPPVTPPIA